MVRGVAAAVGLTLAFLIGAALAILVHVDLPTSRRLAVSHANRLLVEAFMGVRIDRVERLTLFAVEGLDVRVRDSSGALVLRAEDVSAGVGVVQLARSVLDQRGPILVEVPVAFAGHVDATLDRNPKGELRIADAFVTRARAPETNPPRGGRAVSVEVPRIRIAHAWVHGGADPSVDLELSDLSAGVRVKGATTRIDLERVRIVSPKSSWGLASRGVLAGHLVAAPSAPIDLAARLDGEIGGMPTRAELRLRGDVIDARLDAEDSTGANARAMLSELAIKDRVEVRAHAHGTLSHLDATAALSVGKANAECSASIDTRDATRVAARIAARSVDLSRILEGGPVSKLSLEGDGTLTVREGDVAGRASIVIHPGQLDGALVPRVDLSATFGRQRIETAVRIHEASMPTEIVVVLGPRNDGAAGHAVDGRVRATVPDLHRVPMIGARVGGRAAIEGSVRMLLPEHAIDAALDVRGEGIAAPHVSVGDAHAHAVATGRLDRPVVDVTIDANDVASHERTFSHVDARTRIEAHARTVTLHEPRVRILSARHAIGVRARRVAIDERTYSLDGGEVTGLGEPIRGDFVERWGRGSGRVDAPRIDLAIVSELARSERTVRHGSLTLRSDAAWHDGDVSFDLHGAVDELDAEQVHDARAVVDASVHGRAVLVDARAELGSAGELRFRTEDLTIGGRPSDRDAWRRARGAVRIDVQLDAEKVSSLVPADVLPISDVRGRVSLQALLSRDREDGPPEARLSAQTNGLLLAARSEPEARMGGVVIEAPPRWRSTDVDFGVDARCDGMSGLTSVAARATDRRGIVVAIDWKAILPWSAMARDPASFAQRAMEAQMSARLVVPARRLDELPAVIAMKGLEGAVDADIDGKGTMLDPRLRLAMRARDVRSPGMPPGLRMDSDIQATYEDGATELTAAARANGRDLMVASSRVQASLPDVVFRSSGRSPSAWLADGRARISAFPLETIPSLADRGVRGMLSGQLALEGLHRDPLLRGTLDVDGLAVGTTTYARAALTIDAGKGALTGRARVDRTDGFMELSASSGLAWGTNLAPDLDRAQPLEASLVAKDLRAAILQPLVESVVPSLDGRIDADAKLRLEPGQSPRLEGVLSFRDGTVHVRAIGEELRSARARVKLSPDGRIAVDDVFARGARGEVSAEGSVLLHGTELVEATANVRVPKGRPLNLAPDGQPIGQVSGSLHLRASDGADGTTRLVVDVPRATLEIPQVSKRGLQQLARRDNVRAGVYRNATTFVTLPLARADTLPPVATDETPARTDVAVHLGQVEILRGNGAQVLLSGQPSVSVVGDVVRVRGQLELSRGWATVQGRKFELERGTVTWSGEEEPDNPTIVVTAGWTSPEGTRVFADFMGPVASGKVALRSEPPLSKSDILALVLFGTENGANPTPAPAGGQPDGTTRAALGLGGDVAAQGLADALDDLTGLRATARIDTTRSNNLRPELEIQLSPRVSVSFAHVLGTPPVAEPDRNFASIEYRFYGNWSVESTAGDRGRAMVDAIWQRRY